MNDHDEAFVTVREAAAYLRLSESATRLAIKRGDIPSLRVGKAIRIPTRALRELAGQ